MPQPTKLYGIGSGGVSGKLAEVIIVFADEKQVSLPLKTHLLYDDSVAFLIGFEDTLWGGSKKRTGSCWMVVGTM